MARLSASGTGAATSGTSTTAAATIISTAASAPSSTTTVDGCDLRDGVLDCWLGLVEGVGPDCGDDLSDRLVLGVDVVG